MPKKLPKPACSLTKKKEAPASRAPQHEETIQALTKAQEVARASLRQLRTWRKAEKRSLKRLRGKAMALSREDILRIAASKIDGEERAKQPKASPKKIKDGKAKTASPCVEKPAKEAEKGASDVAAVSPTSPDPQRASGAVGSAGE